MDAVAEIVVAIIGDADDVAAAHGTNLGLQEPLAEACLVEHVLAIRYLHDLLLFREILQAYRALSVVKSLSVVENHWFE